jgi:GMP synthase (glutamine-hydrolysing)
MYVLSLDLEPRNDMPPFQAPRWLPPGTPVEAIRVSGEPVPESAEPYSHLILSGSTYSILDDEPCVEPIAKLIRNAVALGRPILGICYGEQLLARVLLGDAHVRRTARPEMGWLPIRVPPRGREIFEGLPNPFHAFVGHFDEVSNLPYGWDTIADREHCEVQGFVNRELRLLGFQFHPEMDIEIGNSCFRAGRDTLERAGFDVEGILREAREDGSGKLLIPRFLEMFAE